MTNEGKLSPEGMDALVARFREQSRKAQAYYAVMHRAKEIAGTDDAASAWMSEPLPPLGGKTPAQLIAEGREADVLRYIDSLGP
ncbi:MbcA/ParS/Xre antitoxin family protein [Noviherbaspirillum sp.]|uniref:MbcA/ParS/Xre antitoxin family protein n=1 Tax=Noviherbaspirillum sp. TaxID=1926288 RepID=UPI002D26ACD8|nr:MbcA/ParS/Xre antitoxin family protein [Noviherbaspirillum sp.]HZW21804.1 MbcA/ParS/Xre antitoxin family protein [Noviherbaspirillum sp.]